MKSKEAILTTLKNKINQFKKDEINCLKIKSTIFCNLEGDWKNDKIGKEIWNWFLDNWRSGPQLYYWYFDHNEYSGKDVVSNVPWQEPKSAFDIDALGHNFFNARHKYIEPPCLITKQPIKVIPPYIDKLQIPLQNVPLNERSQVAFRNIMMFMHPKYTEKGKYRNRVTSDFYSKYPQYKWKSRWIKDVETGRLF